MTKSLEIVREVLSHSLREQNKRGQLVMVARLGYRISVGFVDLVEIGVPQTRRRLILVGSKKMKINVENIQAKYQIDEKRTVKWAIEDLESAEHDCIVDTPSVPSKDNQRRIHYLFEHDLYDLPNEERPPCHRNKKHSYNSIYGRLHWDRPSQTITSGFYSTCMGRYVHPSEEWTLTAHEAARLQFFLDYFDFTGVSNRTSLATIIGNAVPMKLPYLVCLELFTEDGETSQWTQKRKWRYPIIALGNFSGSWIAYLLGVTEKGPLPCYTPEIVWGTDTNPITPDCTIGIAPPVRPLLQKYLDAQHGYIECDRDMFRRISLADSNTCEQLGTLTQKTGQYPSICDLDDAVYSRVANDIAAEFLNENKEAISLVKEALQTESWGFRSLLRLYAFTKSKFKKETYLTNLNAPDFFVSKEELFFCLKHHNVPTDIALEFVKEGIWARGSKRAKYTALLELYEIPKNIKYYFANANNLWMMSSCATRLLHKCYLAWYQEHYPDAFM